MTTRWTLAAAALAVVLPHTMHAQPAPRPAAPRAYETPRPVSSASLLGPNAMRGENYTVRPMAHSDGIMRIFVVESSYGPMQLDGVEFTRMRLKELAATAALEKMSQSDEWAKSFGRTAVAPLKFGVDFLINPAEATGRSVSGIQNMFDRVGANLAGQRSNRDTVVDSLLGVSDAQRQLAFELGVDPYTDFPPLQRRLRDMAGAMAGGQLTVRAGLAAITGGVGIGISAASNVEQAKNTLRDKTAAQVVAEARGLLAALQVPEPLINRFVENRNFTPADLLIVARSLTKLGAQDSAQFIDVAGDAATRNAAYFHRRRAELLAARSGELGGLVAFAPAAGHAINVNRAGEAVAAFPLDDLAWTETTSKTVRAANAELRRAGRRGGGVIATTGLITPAARAEIGKLGWKVVALKPVS